MPPVNWRRIAITPDRNSGAYSIFKVGGFKKALMASGTALAGFVKLVDLADSSIGRERSYSKREVICV